PTGKALRVTEENIKYFEEKASDLKKKNDKDVKEANKFLDKITGKTFVVIRQAGENGQLFGSVTTRDIANLLKDNGIDQIKKNQVSLLEPIKALGIVDVKVNLHAEVSTTIKINIARTEEEAELQERGKVVSLDESQLDEDAVMDVFDEGVEAELSEEVTDEVNDESSVVNDDERTDGSDAVVEEKKDEEKE
ncbi:MAG: 50S ribosomal protein L9, partial [Pseudomonadota bacterium]|nr:50S ribosomal protein L9 [Pseudomonadota bacterium]